MKKIYLYLNINNYKNLDESSLSEFKIEIHEPNIYHRTKHNNNIFRSYIDYFVFYGKYRILYVLDNEKIVHYTYITSKCYRFPFMNNNDIQIGPCYTYEKYRGKKIYKSVLSHIINNTSDNKKIWIYTTEDNHISQRAIESVGFKHVDTLVTTKILKILKSIEEI